MRKWFIFGLITASVLSFGPSLWAAPIVVGTFGGGNCIPFGCSGYFGTTDYQQVYSASEFSSTVPISRITFFACTTGPQYHLDNGTFEISLSYTTRPVNGLSGEDPSDNIGANEALFGSYTLTAATLPAMLSFDGNTFNYDPLLGNLLMTVIVTGASEVSQPFGSFEADPSGTVTSRAVFPLGADAEGLVTGFNYVTPVPEPTETLEVAMVLVALAFVTVSNAAQKKPTDK